MDEFWEESIIATFSCQELSDPSCFSDPFIILGTGWEGGFHTCAEWSCFYLQLSILIIAHFLWFFFFLIFFMHGPMDPCCAQFFWPSLFQMLNLWNSSKETAASHYSSLRRKPWLQGHNSPISIQLMERQVHSPNTSLHSRGQHKLTAVLYLILGCSMGPSVGRKEIAERDLESGIGGTDQGSNPALLLTNCVAWGELYNLSNLACYL